MKKLYKYLKEEIAATPGNTMGMGNPIPAGVNGNIGSEPIPTAKAKKQRKKKSIKESLLDDEEDIISNNDNIIMIEQFLKDNYEIDGKYSIDGNIVNAPAARIKLINKNCDTLTNGLFEFGEVYNFICRRSSIKTLKGAPKSVYSFSCSFCQELTNLEGAPQYIAEFFTCEGCKKITSLKGLPDVVSGELECANCASLKTLKGGPKEIGIHFDCTKCPKLKNLDYLPKIKRNLYCDDDIANSNQDIIKKQVIGKTVMYEYN